MIGSALAGATVCLLAAALYWRWRRRRRIDLQIVVLPQRKTYDLFHGAILGRSPRCEIALTYDETLSMQHAAFYLRRGGWWIKDMDSKNGIFVNGEKIYGEHMLAAGDQLQLGGLKIEVVAKH